MAAKRKAKSKKRTAAQRGAMAKHATKKTAKLIEDVLEHVSEGLTIRTWCKRVNVAPSTFYSWVLGDRELAERLACARLAGEAMIEDEIMEIADSTTTEVDRDKLRIYAREKRLVWSNPGRYSEKKQVAHTGTVKVLSDIEREQRVTELLTKANGGKPHQLEITVEDEPS